jgi:hypothetical protein
MPVIDYVAFYNKWGDGFVLKYLNDEAQPLYLKEKE